LRHAVPYFAGNTLTGSRAVVERRRQVLGVREKKTVNPPLFFAIMPPSGRRVQGNYGIRRYRGLYIQARTAFYP